MRIFTFIKIFAMIAVLLVSGAIKAQGDGQSKETAYTVSEALTAYVDGQAQANTWVKGFIVGYVDGAAIDKGSHFDLTSGEVSASNLLMADSKTETDYTKCLVVQLKSGSSVREVLNLLDNPQNLGKSVKIKGSLEKYFGVAGLKSTTECELEGSEPVEPTEFYKYKKVSSVTNGKKYALVVESEGNLIVAKNLPTDKNYGYLYVDNANEVDGDNITMYDKVYSFTITEVEGGYTIQDESNRYMIMQGNYNSFNVSAERTAGDTWTIEANGDGTFKITNVEMSKYIQYSVQYTSFGSYPDEQGIMPMLYEFTTESSDIAPVVAEDVNAPVEVYTINGVMVGNSLEGLESGLYLVKQGNKVRKVIK